MFLAQGSGVKKVAVPARPLLVLALAAEPLYDFAWGSSQFSACVRGRWCVRQGKKKIKLLVMLCCVLFVNHNVKRKVKLKQIQAVGWKSKQGLSQCLGVVLCLCL